MRIPINTTANRNLINFFPLELLLYNLIQYGSLFSHYNSFFIISPLKIQLIHDSQAKIEMSHFEKINYPAASSGEYNPE